MEQHENNDTPVGATEEAPEQVEPPQSETPEPIPLGPDTQAIIIQSIN